MDEQQWLSGEQVYILIEHLRTTTNLNRTKAGRRKFRLFSCACGRRVWHLMNEPCRNLIEAAEQLVDGKLSEQAFEDLHRQVLTAYHGDMYAIALRGYGVVWAVSINRYPAQMALGAAAGAISDLAGVMAAEQGQEAAAQFMLEEPRRQADLLREIFGNPFRPHPKRRFPAEVRGLAEAAYEDAANYPILADALADLGEDAAAEHCRQPGHVKGCHVVDWVLGRA